MDILEGNHWFEMLRKNWFWALFGGAAIYALISIPFSARKRRRRIESLREVALAMNLKFAEFAELESLPAENATGLRQTRAKLRPPSGTTSKTIRPQFAARK